MTSNHVSSAAFRILKSYYVQFIPPKFCKTYGLEMTQPEWLIDIYKRKHKYSSRFKRVEVNYQKSVVVAKAKLIENRAREQMLCRELLSANQQLSNFSLSLYVTIV